MISVISGLTAHPSSSLFSDGSELGVKKARAQSGSCTPTSAKALPQPRSMGKRNRRAGQQGQM